MRAVIQRVTRACVRVDGRVIGEIQEGLLVLVGVEKGDGESDVSFLVEKIPRLRIFGDASGRMNCSLTETGGGVLAVSQFTLLGDTRKGRRPSFGRAAEPDEARRLFDRFVEQLEAIHGLHVEKGIFGAHMKVELLNDGPVTFILDSKDPVRAPQV